MSTRRKIKVGIVGLGTMGKLHTATYVNNPYTEVVAACDPDKVALEAFISRAWTWPDWWMETLQPPIPLYKISKAYTDYKEMAKDPDLDAISICIPTVFHAAVTIAMLENKKHVMVEKPMAVNSNECQKMIDAAQKANRKLQVGHMWRFHPEVEFVRRAIKKGKIGHIVKTKGYGILVRWAPPGWYNQKKLVGGGPLIDMGVHPIDTVRYLLDEPKANEVFAVVKTAFGNYDVDDMAVVMIKFSDGTVSIIETGQNNPYSDGGEASTQLFGTKGYARIFPTELQFKINDQWGIFKPDIQEPHFSMKMYQWEIDHFVNCILTDKEPMTSGKVALETIKIIEAAYESSEKGVSVKVKK